VFLFFFFSYWCIWIIQRGFIVTFPYMHIISFDHLHLLYCSFLAPFPLVLTILVYFSFILFLYIHKMYFDHIHSVWVRHFKVLAIYEDGDTHTDYLHGGPFLTFLVSGPSGPGFGLPNLGPFCGFLGFWLYFLWWWLTLTRSECQWNVSGLCCLTVVSYLCPGSFFPLPATAS
jgi:hypothetical protein